METKKERKKGYKKEEKRKRGREGGGNIRKEKECINSKDTEKNMFVCAVLCSMLQLCLTLRPM